MGSLVSASRDSLTTSRKGLHLFRAQTGPRSTATLGAHANLGLLVHFDLGDHPTSRGFQPGEVDASGLSDQAAPAVTAHEVLRP